MKRLALSTAIVLATLAIVTILVRFPEAVLLFLITLAIAAATRPMVETLSLRGLPRGVAVVITYLSIIGSVVVVLFAVSGLLFADLQHLGDRFIIYYDTIWKSWPTGSQLQQTIIGQLPPPQQLITDITGEKGTALAQTLLGITSSSFATLSQVFGVLVLSVYWTIDRIHFERLWLSLLPAEIRARWREVGRDVETDLGGYIRSEVVQSLLAGFVLGLGFNAIGLPYSNLLALFCALAWLIPWLGGPIAVIGVFLAGWITSGLAMAAGAAVMTGVVLALLELLVEPHMFHRRQYSPWLAVLFILALGDSVGLAGIIIAPPLAAMTQMIGRRMMQETAPIFATNQDLESARRIAQLDDRMTEVRALIGLMEAEPNPQTMSMLNRLGSLIGEANQVIAEETDR
jgi:putative permease